MKKGTDYGNNYVYANFNKANFTNKLFKEWGKIYIFLSNYSGLLLDTKLLMDGKSLKNIFLKQY